MITGLRRLFRTFSFFLILSHPAFLFSQNVQSYSKILLENGLTLFILQDTTLPLIHLNLFSKNGALFEDDQSRGSSRVLEEALLNTCTEFSEPIILEEEFQILGAKKRATTKGEWSEWSLSAMPHDLQLALELFHKTITKPGFSDYELPLIRSKLEKKYQEWNNSSFFYFRQDLEKRLWGDRFDEKDLYGDYTKSRELTETQLESIHKKYIHPTNCALIIAGDVDELIAESLAQETFGLWPSNPGGFSTDQKQNDMYPPAQSGLSIFENELAPIPAITFLWQIPISVAPHQDLARTGLLVQILNEAPNSIRNQLLKTGKALQVNASHDFSAIASGLRLEIIPNPDSLRPCYEAAHQILQEMQDPNWLDEEVFKRAKRQLGFEQRYKNERITDRSQTLGRSWALNVMPLFDSFSELLDQVEIAQLKLEIQNTLRPDRAVYGIMCSNLQRRFWDLDELLDVKIVSNDFPDPNKTEPVIEPKDNPELNETQKEINLQLNNSRIYFETNSFNPDETSVKVLEKIARLLKGNPEMKVFVDGHTDTSGDSNYNMTLSVRRALAIKKYLMTNFRIHPDRMEVRGFGESDPEFEEKDIAGMAKNRRVIIQANWKGGDL